jgi:hypothetical protein
VILTFANRRVLLTPAAAADGLTLVTCPAASTVKQKPEGPANAPVSMQWRFTESSTTVRPVYCFQVPSITMKYRPV